MMYQDGSLWSHLWTRRVWLARHTTALMLVPAARLSGRWGRAIACLPTLREGRVRNDADTLAQRAVEAARQAGAQYADARITCTTQHSYNFGSNQIGDIETVGVGVRALAHGYWGFSASPSGDVADVERLAKDAVAQAVINAEGAVTRTVELAQTPVVTGTWRTPVTIDPFTVPIEEKHEFMRYWERCALKAGLEIDAMQSHLLFTREARTIATSEGSQFTQTQFESGGKIVIKRLQRELGSQVQLPIRGIEMAGRGWELFLDANIPEQMRVMPDQLTALETLEKGARPATIGRYTIVCDGATMAALLEATLGVGLQIDRALGYEANAGGTSFLDDPLTMLGVFKVASPQVNVTANRSAPAQLATIRWDDEGVIPSEAQLVKDGVLTDFQTTREQATWLAPYYTKLGHAVHSNGCAAAENALRITMQHMPNLSLEPGAAAVRMEDLIANVQDGILIEGGMVFETDFQARNGLLIGSGVGQMRKIQNGRAGHALSGGVLQFNTLDLWRKVVSIGGPSTRAVVAASQYPYGAQFAGSGIPGTPLVKGEPAQTTSHSVQAVAATIVGQPLINLLSKA